MASTKDRQNGLAARCPLRTSIRTPESSTVTTRVWSWFWNVRPTKSWAFCLRYSRSWVSAAPRVSSVARNPKSLPLPSRALTSAVRRLVSTRKLCTLKGGVSTGRRPYFHFANAHYSAEWLVLRTDLIGKLLWLQLEDEDDARFVSVSNERGEFLGVVRAAPPWHRSPHTLYMRQAIRALEKRRALHLSGQSDAVEELIRYAEGSRGKKLPPHPAYLEARRVLRQHAQELVDEPMVARASEPPSSPSSPSVKTTKKPEQPTAPEKPGKADKPRRPLPPMEMAKTW